MTALSSPPDLAPLRQRLGLLSLVRLAISAVGAAAVFLLPPEGGGGAAIPLLALSALYAVTCAAVELVRRRLGTAGISLVATLVLLDGMYLAVVVASTGGAHSVLSFLVVVHIIAVTLLLSFRSGLKTALWHALLLFGISWLQEAGLFGASVGLAADEAVGFRALALLVVAASAAWFSSLNENELRRGKGELRALSAMASKMAARHDPVELSRALLEGVADAFSFSRAAVLFSSGDGWRAFVRHPDGDVAEVDEAPGGAGGTDSILSGRRVHRPELLRVVDPAGDPLLARSLPGAANLVVVPMVAGGQVLGALAIELAGGREARIPARTVDLMGQFAAHCALALRAAALRIEVMRLADTDALTGLANRRVFQITLAHEMALAARRREPCSLILLDIDHFKFINDTYGHQAGDDVLRHVGRALREAARESDVAARYGGEEFAVILPSCPPGEALVVAERLRQAIAAGSGPVAVTISAGVAGYPVDARDETVLLAAADKALYQAKRTGRNRAVVFGPSGRDATAATPGRRGRPAPSPAR